MAIKEMLEEIIDSWALAAGRVSYAYKLSAPRIKMTSNPKGNVRTAIPHTNTIPISRSCDLNSIIRSMPTQSSSHTIRMINERPIGDFIDIFSSTLLQRLLPIPGNLCLVQLRRNTGVDY